MLLFCFLCYQILLQCLLGLLLTCYGVVNVAGNFREIRASSEQESKWVWILTCSLWPWACSCVLCGVQHFVQFVLTRSESDCIRNVLRLCEVHAQTVSGTCSDCIRCMLRLYQVHAQTVSGTHSDYIRYTLRLYRVNTFHFQCTFHILNARVDPLFHILNAGVDPLKDL